MLGAALSFAYAFAIFALMTEIHSPILLMLGWIFAGWSTFVGAFNGWQAARND